MTNMKRVLAITSKDAEPTATRPLQSPTLLFWLVAGVPLIALLLSFPLVCSRLFTKYADKPGQVSERDLYLGNNKPCDVLIYGDSTAVVGLDPRIISDGTHLTTCNISVMWPTLRVLGLTPLDRYLSRNPKPKFLLFQFNVDNMQQVPIPGLRETSTEAIMPLIRYDSPRTAFRVMAKYPDTFIGLLHYAYFWSLIDLRDKYVTKNYPAITEEAGSYIESGKPPLQSCPGFNPAPAGPQTMAWIDFLRSHYGAVADHVLINAAPVSVCNPFYPQWQSALLNKVDNRVVLYPLNSFVDADFHLTRVGAIRYSEDTAQEILRREEQSSAR
jgi:hypothetical protein